MGAIRAPDRAARAIALILTLMGGLLLLHGGLWAAAMLAVLGLSLMRGRLAYVATAAGMIVFFGAIFTLAPQKQGHVLVDSLMLRKSVDRFRTLPVYTINPKSDRSARDIDESRSAYVRPVGRDTRFYDLSVDGPCRQENHEHQGQKNCKAYRASPLDH